MNNFLKKLVVKEDLNKEEIKQVLASIINGSLSPVLAGAFLVSLSMKGESDEEIFGIVEFMREQMLSLDLAGKILDTCGTGGDGASTINVSTMSAFVCATFGVIVAKHGNRSVSSKCGSFDVLEGLGVKIDLNPKQASKCFLETGIVCLFAPIYHPAMKNIGPIRKELGIRTIFNFIGPLLNPAKATHQLIGVSSLEKAEKLGRIMMRLGSKKVLVVHSDDGLDEVSVAAPTQVFEFNQNQEIRKYFIKPKKLFGLKEVLGSDKEFNAGIVRNIFSGKGTEAQNEFVALNAGLALLASEAVPNFETGRRKALELILSGEVLKKLEEVIKVTNEV